MPSTIALSLNPDVVCSSLPDGGVLLDLETKQYFALNASGLLVWQHLEDGGSLSTLWSALAAQDLAGLEAFADTLIELGLASNAAAAGQAPSGEAPPLAPFRAPWTPPSVTPHGRPLSQVILSPFDPTVPIPE